MCLEFALVTVAFMIDRSLTSMEEQSSLMAVSRIVFVIGYYNCCVIVRQQSCFSLCPVQEVQVAIAMLIAVHVAQVLVAAKVLEAEKVVGIRRTGKVVGIKGILIIAKVQQGGGQAVGEPWPSRAVLIAWGANPGHPIDVINDLEDEVCFHNMAFWKLDLHLVSIDDVKCLLSDV
eukprot:s2118_g5.t1